MEPIEPADVFVRVMQLESQIGFLSRIVGFLCILVTLQILFKFVIFARVLRVLDRVEKLLVLVELHGTLTDNKAEAVKSTAAAQVNRLAEVVTQTGHEIKTEVPARVAEIIRNPDSVDSSPGSGVRTVPGAKPPDATPPGSYG